MKTNEALTATAASLFLVVVLPASGGETSTRFKPFGDFRVRHESDLNRPGQEDRHRERIRLRVGGSYDLDETWSVVGAVRTGSPDSPRSPHQTLGNNFDSFSIALDQAFVRWQPAQWKGFSATAGKFPQPFVTNPVYGELQWDTDLRPEGLTLNYRASTGKNASLNVTLARYLLLERDEGADVGVWAGQVSFKAAPRDGVDWNMAFDFHAVGDTQPDGAQKVVGRNSGNLLVDRDGDGQGDAFASEFHLLHPLVALRLSNLGLGRPLTLSAEMVHNGAASNGDDTAIALGASLGQSAKKGEWSLYWQYLKVEQEAVFSVVAQDDFPRSTNFRGHLLGLRYMFHDRANFNLWTLPSRNDGQSQTDWQWRLRADLNLSL